MKGRRRSLTTLENPLLTGLSGEKSSPQEGLKKIDHVNANEAKSSADDTSRDDDGPLRSHWECCLINRVE